MLRYPTVTLESRGVSDSRLDMPLASCNQRDPSNGVNVTHPSSTQLTNLVVCCMLGGVLAHGCGDDLGECDRAAAEEVVFSRDGLVATKGQALIHDSCGNGAYCHSSAAKLDDRYGAQAGLNFDMLPVPNGWPEVMENRDEIWEVVLDGDMPPDAAGRKVRGDGKWMFDYRRPEGAPELAALSTHAGKAALRNWLACGAPLVSQTRLPEWARAASGSATPNANDFDSIYETVLRGTCAAAGCHNMSAAGELRMLDACNAYESLMQTGPCGRLRVKAGDASSFLLNKISGGKVECGGQMPPTGPLPVNSVMAIRAWVLAGAPAPKDCP